MRQAYPKDIENYKNLVQQYEQKLKDLKDSASKEDLAMLLENFESLIHDLSSLSSTVEDMQVQLQQAMEEIEKASGDKSKPYIPDFLKCNFDTQQNKETCHRNNFNLFSAIFPDNESCYKYLAEYKWRDGFRCNRCENEKWCKGQGNMARRCTKCAYNESVTAFTLYHGCKFDLNKAFYMSFIVSSKNKNISTYELAEALSLEQKTCWKFKHKILNALEDESMKSRSWEFLTYEYLKHYYFAKLSILNKPKEN